MRVTKARIGPEKEPVASRGLRHRSSVLFPIGHGTSVLYKASIPRARATGQTCPLWPAARQESSGAHLAHLRHRPVPGNVESGDRIAPLLFTTGYLVAWAAAGVAAFAVARFGGAIAGDVLAWDRAGRWVAGATLLVAAAYELTPLKDVCLAKCRSPVGFLLGAWRDGRTGSLQMGVRHGGWCVGCCWALMASLLAMGVMSVAWMAFVAALIAAEKTLPWRRVATYATAGLLLALGLLLLVAPDVVPALTIPVGKPMQGMDSMGS